VNLVIPLEQDGVPVGITPAIQRKFGIRSEKSSFDRHIKDYILFGSPNPTRGSKKLDRLLIVAGAFLS